MEGNKFIYSPQDSFFGGNSAGDGAAALSSSIGVGASSYTSTTPPLNCTMTHNPNSVPQSNNASQFMSAANNTPQGEDFSTICATKDLDRTSQALGTSNTGENRRELQSTASVEPCLTQLPAFISPSPSVPRSNSANSFSVNKDYGGNPWNRMLHHAQPGTSICAFAESSRDAQARLARSNADSQCKRVVSYLDYDDEPVIDEDRNILSEDIYFVIGSDYSDDQEGDSENGNYDAEYEVDDSEHRVSKQQRSVNRSKRIVTSNRRIPISGREAGRRQLKNEKIQNLKKRSKEDAQRPLLVAEGVTCSFRDCNLKSPFRRTISAFFGRNKKGGRDVPLRVWLHICRKHYQRTKYRDKDKYVNAQCDRIETQFDRLEEWSNATLAANQGPHIEYWTTALGKKEADYQASLKNADGAHAKIAQDEDKKKAPAQEKDEDKPFIKGEAIDEIFDEKDNIWHAPAWLVALQGRQLSFEEIRKVFARLRLETQSIPNRTLPSVEFLPHLIFLGDYQPKKVTYAKRNKNQSNVNGKSKATGIKIEESDDDEDNDSHYRWEEEQKEGYDDVMADTVKIHDYHKRKRDETEDADDQGYKRRRPAAAARSDNNLTHAFIQRGGFEIRSCQTPNPSQRHMDVQQLSTSFSFPFKRERYVPSWQRQENNAPPAQDEVKDEAETYQPPVFTPKGLAKKNYR